MLANTPDYLDALNQIKDEIRNTRTRAARTVNSELICMYWRIGSELLRHSEWGNKYIDTLSRDIREAFPGIKGFSPRYLKYMKKFASENDYEIVQTLFAQLSWSHNLKLMDKLSSSDVRAWYARTCIDEGWSLVVLDHQIDLKAYERNLKEGKTHNFSRTLPDPQSEMVQQAFKDPYIFDFITAEQSREERDIEQAMMDNVQALLLELGTGFALVGRQYHLVVGESDFYIDMLFYNIKLHCYVVIELKNKEFKPEFSGKLGFYVAAIDGELRGEGDNPTIGLLLCKTKDDMVAEYSLQTVNAPIGVSEYRTGADLPEEFANVLPSPEDLAARI